MKLGFAGGAQEVGGSCICLRVGDVGILMDAGIRQGGGRDPLPDFRLIQEMGGIDAILISHAHMDHIGSLPLISRAYPRAPIYMTPMTMDLTRVLLQNLVFAEAGEAARQAGLTLKKNPAYLPMDRTVQLKVLEHDPDAEEKVIALILEKTGLPCRIV